MKIDSQTVNNINTVNKSNISTETDTAFADELKNIKNENKDQNEKTQTETKEVQPEVNENENLPTQSDNDSKKMNNALENLNDIVVEFRQTDEKSLQKLNKRNIFADKKFVKDEAGDKLIDNNMNVQDNNEKLPKMSLNMGFSGDGQPFSSFMNNQNALSQLNKDKLSNNAKDLAEEAAILSTMSENIAIANRNELLKQEAENLNNNEITVINTKEIKKTDLNKNITTEVIVKYDSVIMNQADVEIFTNLVLNGEVDMNNLSPESAERSVTVSKTLADMLAKSMQDNTPLRIDFDNNISVIIKISRNGKITADFLPSSQVAETYLKENLPLLKQRFDEEHIDYDSLNQRQRNKNQENNKRKERNNE